MELILLFGIVLSCNVLILAVSKFVDEKLLKAKLLYIGAFLLLSLWIGLFIETPELENGTWIAFLITSSFLLGLNIFFLLFFQVFSEKFYSLPSLSFSYYIMQPIFLNLFCLINAILLYFIRLSFEIRLLVTSLFAHSIIMLLYFSFYHRAYNKIQEIKLSLQFKLYLFFAVVSILYFAIGYMAIFVLTPLNASNLK